MILKLLLKFALWRLRIAQKYEERVLNLLRTRINASTGERAYWSRVSREYEQDVFIWKQRVKLIQEW